MTKVRVLIVDDSVVIRRLLSESLALDSNIEIAGVAANGNIALQKIPQCSPDLITLDIEMPEKDGLETLKEVRKIYPKLPVIMFSTLTERGGARTLEALSLGATDYVTKPANVGSVGEGMKRIQEDLIPKILGICRRSSVTNVQTPKAPTPVLPPRVVAGQASPVPGAAGVKSSGISVVTIGTSTGGPNALAELLPGLPEDFPVPIVIVQHMPPVFTGLLANRLNSQSKLEVREAQAGDALRAGLVLLAPGGSHMALQRRGAGVCVGLNQDPPENSCRPAVDVLFRSVARLYGPSTLSVVLTGMGKDGLLGCEAIRNEGGQVVVQDEESSVVWGMPGFVAQAGLAHRVLPLGKIADEIRRRVGPGDSALSRSLKIKEAC